MCDAGTAFAWDFVATGNVDDLDGVIGEFTAETGGKIISAGFEEKNVGLELPMELFERVEIGRNIFTNGGVRTAAGFDGANSFGGERVVPNEEFTVFAGENIVGDGGDVHLFAKPATKLKHEGSFAASDGPADADGECALRKITIEREVAVVEMARMIHMFVSVAMIVIVVVMMV